MEVKESQPQIFTNHPYRDHILHPANLLLLLGNFLLSGQESSPLVLKSKLPSAKWVGVMSFRLRWATEWAAAAWILSTNRN